MFINAHQIISGLINFIWILSQLFLLIGYLMIKLLIFSLVDYYFWLKCQEYKIVCSCLIQVNLWTL